MDLKALIFHKIKNVELVSQVKHSCINPFIFGSKQLAFFWPINGWNVIMLSKIY